MGRKARKAAPAGTDVHSPEDAGALSDAILATAIEPAEMQAPMPPENQLPEDENAGLGESLHGGAP